MRVATPPRWRDGRPPARPTLTPNPTYVDPPRPSRPEGVITSHRMCHLCKTPIRLTNWLDHQEAIHGIVATSRRHHPSLDLTLDRPEAEPARKPEPPCDQCGAERCQTPLICARHRRARQQHHWTGKKAA